MYRLFESYYYHIAADELTSPNGGIAAASSTEWRLYSYVDVFF